MIDISRQLENYSGQPITHQALTHILKDYKRPNDKINALKAKGVLTTIRRGLYIAGDTIRIAKPENGLLANHLYGPSYISLDTALSQYGLIPERVYTTTSITTKASRKFITPGGAFTYTHLPLPYYAFGLKIIRLNSNQQAVIASPEKALADKIVTTAGILLRSISSAQDYLLENLRIEENDLKEFDTTTMQSWLTHAPKKESLEMVIRTIEKL